jgi:preprotein translocase subunit SecB
MLDSTVINPSIKVVTIRFTDFRMCESDAFKTDPDAETQITLSGKLHFTDETHFIVEFNLELEHVHFDATIKMMTMFQTDTVIDEAFKQSELVHVNAPAIAFPFLRSFVTTMTSNAGYQTVMLPALNLAGLKN